jgi:hypothetical protein
LWSGPQNLKTILKLKMNRKLDINISLNKIANNEKKRLSDLADKLFGKKEANKLTKRKQNDQQQEDDNQDHLNLEENDLKNEEHKIIRENMWKNQQLTLNTNYWMENEDNNLWAAGEQEQIDLENEDSDLLEQASADLNVKLLPPQCSYEGEFDLMDAIISSLSRMNEENKKIPDDKDTALSFSKTTTKRNFSKSLKNNYKRKFLKIIVIINQ